MTGTRDRLRNDLDERNTGPVVVDERIVGAMDAPRRSTGMRELAGVFLHVHALDLDAHHLRAVCRGHGDVEVAV